MKQKPYSHKSCKAKRKRNMIKTLAVAVGKWETRNAFSKPAKLASFPQRGIDTIAKMVWNMMGKLRLLFEG